MAIRLIKEEVLQQCTKKSLLLGGRLDGKKKIKKNCLFRPISHDDSMGRTNRQNKGLLRSSTLLQSLGRSSNDSSSIGLCLFLESLLWPRVYKCQPEVCHSCRSVKYSNNIQVGVVREDENWKTTNCSFNYR